jgi:mannose-6-phosphate isomerase-like protein (cupin superfamily)
LSLQRHRLRSEHWIIAAGTGVMTLDDKTWALSTGQYVHVPVEGVHRVQNDGTENLIIIETQLGICDENDIERLEDDYGRS